MSSYLVDTNVISAGSPTRASADFARLVTWMDRHTDSLFLSVVTIAEIEDGISKARRDGAHRKAGRLADWLETVLHLYSSRILVFDVATARLAGALSDRARGQGHAPGFPDLVIAATAKLRGLTILTRNLRHFVPLAVSAHDPFAHLPV
jgi:predicted nucleic acid-binding protein